MKHILLILIFLLSQSIYSQSEESNMQEYINDISVKNMLGEEVKFSDYNDKVLLIVNVASKCGYTRQYEGLQNIYNDYKDQGFEVLAFPCNDFGGQEPGSNEQIKEFCSVNFGVQFTLFDKVKVLGEEKAELYQRLTNSPNVENGDIKWNFEKFLIGKDGKILQRFRSKVEPESAEMKSAIENALNS